VLAHEDLVALTLQGPLGTHRVGGEVRHTGAGPEDDDPALLEVANGAPRNVRFGDLTHRDGRLDPGVDALLLEEVLEGQAVHDGAQHAHVVGARALHPLLLQLGPAEEVAAADDDCDLDSLADAGRDLPGNSPHHVRVDSDGSPSERFTGQFEQNPTGTTGAEGGGLRGNRGHGRSP
jgi:hypothetical protein